MDLLNLPLGVYVSAGVILLGAVFVWLSLRTPKNGLLTGRDDG